LKETQIREIAKKCDLSFDSLTPLKDEASGRSYWRVSRDKESFVLCYLNPNLGDHESFISVAEQLDAHDINAPKIISHHPSIAQDDSHTVQPQSRSNAQAHETVCHLIVLIRARNLRFLNAAKKVHEEH